MLYLRGVISSRTLSSINRGRLIINCLVYNLVCHSGIWIQHPGSVGVYPWLFTYTIKEVWNWRAITMIIRTTIASIIRQVTACQPIWGRWELRFYLLPNCGFNILVSHWARIRVSRCARIRGSRVSVINIRVCITSQLPAIFLHFYIWVCSTS